MINYIVTLIVLGSNVAKPIDKLNQIRAQQADVMPANDGYNQNNNENFNSGSNPVRPKPSFINNGIMSFPNKKPGRHNQHNNGFNNPRGNSLNLEVIDNSNYGSNMRDYNNMESDQEIIVDPIEYGYLNEDQNQRFYEIPVQESLPEIQSDYGYQVEEPNNYPVGNEIYEPIETNQRPPVILPEPERRPVMRPNPYEPPRESARPNSSEPAPAPAPAPEPTNQEPNPKPASQEPAPKPNKPEPAPKPATQGPASKPANSEPAPKDPEPASKPAPKNPEPAPKPANSEPASKDPEPASKPANSEPAPKDPEPASKPAANSEPASKNPEPAPKPAANSKPAPKSEYKS